MKLLSNSNYSNVTRKKIKGFDELRLTETTVKYALWKFQQYKAVFTKNANPND